MLNLKKKNKGFTLVEMVVVITILGILATVLVPAVKNHLDSAKKVVIQTQCREIVIAVETYNGEVKSMEQICSNYNNNFIVCNKLAMIKIEKTTYTFENILMKIKIQHLLGDTTNEVDVTKKDGKTSYKLKKKFDKIPPRTTYEQIKRVAEGANFEMNGKGVLCRVENEDGSGMESVDIENKK